MQGFIENENENENENEYGHEEIDEDEEMPEEGDGQWLFEIKVILKLDNQTTKFHYE